MPDEAKHSPAWACPVPALRAFHRLRAIGCLVLIGAPALGGCAMSMGSLAPADDDVTGSLAKVPFGALLDAEDRRRETAALATAVDPQGDGSTIRWENPKTGRKGSLTAVGHAYPTDSRICRAFQGELDRSGDKRAMQGTACTVAAGVWEVTDTKPVTKKA